MLAPRQASIDLVDDSATVTSPAGIPAAVATPRWIECGADSQSVRLSLPVKEQASARQVHACRVFFVRCTCVIQTTGIGQR